MYPTRVPQVLYCTSIQKDSKISTVLIINAIDANRPYCVEYLPMKRIFLTGKRGKGKFALVDDEDYDYLNQFKWHLSTKGYAVRSYRGKKVHMHRVVNKTPKNKETDHKHGNKLNNQKYNLRTATGLQNSANSRPHKDSSSKYKGVHYRQGRAKPWAARIYHEGKEINLGYSSKEKEAALAYNEEALKLKGKFAYLNKI